MVPQGVPAASPNSRRCVRPKLRRRTACSGYSFGETNFIHVRSAEEFPHPSHRSSRDTGIECGPGILRALHGRCVPAEPANVVESLVPPPLSRVTMMLSAGDFTQKIVTGVRDLLSGAQLQNHISIDRKSFPTLVRTNLRQCSNAPAMFWLGCSWIAQYRTTRYSWTGSGLEPRITNTEGSACSLSFRCS